MKALVYHGPGQKSWDTVPNPTLQPRSRGLVDSRQEQIRSPESSDRARAQFGAATILFG